MSDDPVHTDPALQSETEQLIASRGGVWLRVWRSRDGSICSNGCTGVAVVESGLTMPLTRALLVGGSGCIVVRVCSHDAVVFEGSLCVAVEKLRCERPLVVLSFIQSGVSEVNDDTNRPTASCTIQHCAAIGGTHTATFDR